MFLYILPVFLLFSLLPCQTIRVSNESSALYSAWIRVPLTTPTPLYSGWRLTTYSMSNNMTPNYLHVDSIYTFTHIEDNFYHVDLKVNLGPGEVKDYNLTSFIQVIAPIPQIPIDFPFKADGMPKINNVSTYLFNLLQGPSNVFGQIHNGRAFTPIMLANFKLYDVMLRMSWYPDQPGWCKGTAYIIPKVTTTLSSNIIINWGNALITPLNGISGILYPAGKEIDINQIIDIPITFVWWTYIPVSLVDSAIADINYSVVAKQI